MHRSSRVLGWYHILGALAGGLMTVWAHLRGAELALGALWASALPFALTMAAGRLLLAGDSRGRRLGYVVQALQIPIVMLPAVTWKFIAGLIASVTVTAAGGGLYAGVEATWFVGSGGLNGFPATLGLNLVPAVVIVLLVRAGRAATPAVPAGGKPARPAA